MFNIGVYVTSRYADYVEFKNALNEAIKKYIPVGKPNALCTGSTKSNSSGNGLVRRYAFENGIPCRIFETQWEKHIPTKPGKRNTAGVRANAMIVKNSNGCCMFWTPTSVAKWDFMSGGCYNFRKMCGKMGRELIPIKVDIYKPLTKEEPQPKDNGTEERPIGDIGGGTRASDLLGGNKTVAIPSSGVGGGGTTSTDVGRAFTSMGQPSIDSEKQFSSSNAASTASTTAVPSTKSAAVSTNVEGNIVDIPVDITGDGVPDVNIPAVDTNGDKTPDSMVIPVDTDGNGTMDTVKVEPLSNEILKNAALPTSTVSQTSAPSPITAVPQQTQSSAPINTTSAPDDDKADSQT